MLLTGRGAFDKSSNESYIDLYCSGRVKNTREHGYSVFRERIRSIFEVLAMSQVQGHRL